MDSSFWVTGEYVFSLNLRVGCSCLKFCCTQTRRGHWQWSLSVTLFGWINTSHNYVIFDTKLTNTGNAKHQNKFEGAAFVLIQSIHTAHCSVRTPEYIAFRRPLAVCNQTPYVLYLPRLCTIGLFTSPCRFFGYTFIPTMWHVSPGMDPGVWWVWVIGTLPGHTPKSHKTE